MPDPLSDLFTRVEVAKDLLRDFNSLAPDLAQLLQGWHADGTAWSEWDETVYQRLLALQERTEEFKP